MVPTRQPSPWSLALRIMSDFGVTIAVPVVLFAWLGKRLDLHYQTSPWFLILGFALALLLSGTMVYRKAKIYARLYKKM
ncbi:MAG: AtpZ/AtpI family protein [Parcubacteria group bacterium]|nr:AtpZ/AtpI family protein [Parcubacteria group bacterium]